MSLPGSATNIWRRAELALLFAAALAGAVWSLDASVQAQVDAAAPPAAPSTREAPPPGRAFVLLIDSLRYQTATDPAVMAFLASARERGAVAKVRSVRDAVTTSALRAAFTGREHVAVFGFVKNFVRGDEGQRSIFSALAESGRTAGVYSDGSFNQFGRAIARVEAMDAGGQRVAEGAGTEDHGEQARQVARVREAVQAYLAGDEAIVVAHVTFGDHRSHSHGVHDPEYQEAFAAADALAREVDAAIPAADTLVVMGDHGHDEAGRHALGLDVPTFASYRGPRFRTHADLGTVATTAHTYLLSWALGLPLDPAYQGPALPDALAGPAPIPSSFAAPRPSLPPVPRAPLTATLLLAVHFALAVAIGLRRAFLPAGAARVGAASWAVAVLLPLDGASLAAASCGALAAAAVGFAVAEGTPRRRALLVAAVAAAGLACAAWGVALTLLRPWAHALEFLDLMRFWAVAAAVAVLAAARFGAMRVAWVALALPMLLFHPTVYRYGWAGAMGPSWLLAVVLLLLEARRLGGGRWRVSRDGLAGLGVVLLLGQFLFTDGDNFQSQGFWGPLQPTSLAQWIALAVFAKLVILVRPSRGVVANAVALPAAALVLCAQWDVLPPSIGLRAGLAAAFALLWAAAALLPLAPEVRVQARHVFAVSGLMLATQAFVVVPRVSYFLADALLAALVLSAALLARMPDPSKVRSGWLLLHALAVVACGWTTLAWTVHRLEWHALYTVFEASFVEGHVWLFVPFIALKYALPLVLARYLLGELEPPSAVAWPGAAAAVTLKAATLALTVFGAALLDASSGPYLEAVQHAAVLLALSFGTVFVRAPARTAPELAVTAEPVAA